MLFLDEDGRVLLVEPTYKEHWDIPGGYVEEGETPTEACAREVAEELGLEVTPGHLLVVDWAPIEGEGDKILFVFDGGTLTANETTAIRLDSMELAAYEFVDVGALTDRLIPRLARRLAAAVNARKAGRTQYLEHGHVMGGRVGGTPGPARER
jgi:8-oxo-dGTP diphosphatase